MFAMANLDNMLMECGRQSLNLNRVSTRTGILWVPHDLITIQRAMIHF